MNRGSRLALLVALAAIAQPASAYDRSLSDTGAPVKWPVRLLTYMINEAGSDDIPFTGVEKVVERSFQTWESVECSDVTFEYLGPTADDHAGYYEDGRENHNILVWREESNQWPHDLGALAVTTVTFCNDNRGAACKEAGDILDADIEVNGAGFVFGADARPFKVDLRNTVTHEIGHFIGFDHTTLANFDTRKYPAGEVEDTTMYASAQIGEIQKRTLHGDDIDGLCAVYPSGEASPSNAEWNVSTGDSGGCDAAASRAPGGTTLWPWLLLLVAGRLRFRGGGRARTVG